MQLLIAARRFLRRDFVANLELALPGLAAASGPTLRLLDAPHLRSVWLEGTIGYAATPWVHLEVFYSGTQQTIDRPGGQIDRNRIGFQVITAKPVRIR